MMETKEIEGHWVGKEKERYDFTLKLLEQKSTTRGYWVYRMKDKYGNLFIAFDGRPEWLVDNHSINDCLLYTSPSPRDRTRSRMPSSA